MHNVYYHEPCFDLEHVKNKSSFRHGYLDRRKTKKKNRTVIRENWFGNHFYILLIFIYVVSHA